MIRPNTVEYYQNRLEAYKKQLKALMVDENYKNHEAKKLELKKYYEEQIIRYETKLEKNGKTDTNRINEITVNGAVEVNRIGKKILR